MVTGKKRALILGIGGQDGSYLADLLLEKGYDVHGLHRKSSADNLRRISHIRDKVVVHQGDITDTVRISSIISSGFDEIYNMADQDSVTWSFDNPGYQWDVTAGAVGRILEFLRQYHDASGRPRFFQPSSATIFGNARAPQTEGTPINPLSPYACAKAAVYHLCRYYRQVHGMFISCGIMFNHDSPRRKPDYICQKIARGAWAVSEGRADAIAFGNLDTLVDVGWAPEYISAAHRMLQHTAPDDFVVSSGHQCSIRMICREAFNVFGLDYKNHIVFDEKYNRPDAGELFGDSSKALDQLDWLSGHNALGVVQKLCIHLKEYGNEAR